MVCIISLDFFWRRWRISASRVSLGVKSASRRTEQEIRSGKLWCERSKLSGSSGGLFFFNRRGLTIGRPLDIDLFPVGTPSGLALFCSSRQILGLRLSFFTILLVKFTSRRPKWPKLSFGEVEYRLIQRHDLFGDYYVSMFCAWLVEKVHFLA